MQIYQPPQNQLRHWIKHSILPLCILSLLLLLPRPWQPQSPSLPTTVIHLKLLKQQPKQIKTSKQQVVEGIKPPVVQAVVPQPKSQSAVKPRSVKMPRKPVLKNKVSKPNRELSSAAVIKMMQSVADPLVKDRAFMPKEKNQLAFNRSPRAADIYADLPYLDTSVDAPELDMVFYSAGVGGDIERLVDKVTVEKEFTTKYGTKVKCAMIALLAVCGWK